MSDRNGSTPAVLVEDLTKRYADFDALAGLSFEVPYGEIFGFVGPNGAGKTTTFRILATLLEPTSGRAVIDGIEVTGDPYAARDHIGYMPDFFGVYDRLTAWEYLAFYARCYDIHGSRVDSVATDLLELVRLEVMRGDDLDHVVLVALPGLADERCGGDAWRNRRHQPEAGPRLPVQPQSRRSRRPCLGDRTDH